MSFYPTSDPSQPATPPNPGLPPTQQSGQPYRGIDPKLLALSPLLALMQGGGGQGGGGNPMFGLAGMAGMDPTMLISPLGHLLGLFGHKKNGGGAAAAPAPSSTTPTGT